MNKFTRLLDGENENIQNVDKTAKQISLVSFHRQNLSRLKSDVI